jgi:hypothetical protein
MKTTEDKALGGRVRYSVQMERGCNPDLAFHLDAVSLTLTLPPSCMVLLVIYRHV